MSAYPVPVLAVALTVTLSTPDAVRAEEVLRDVSWREMSRRGELRDGEVLGPDDEAAFDHLRVESRSGESTTWTVAVLESPGISQTRYAVRGRVRHSGVEGEGYLEMWSIFPDGGAYFSRTREVTGPMQRLTGQSDWRTFVLPFFIQDTPARPDRLVVNVVLPGRGAVELGPLRLVQFGPDESPLAREGQWWSEATAGLMGAIGGTIMGFLGGLIGWFGSKGKAASFVIGTLKALVLVGIVLLGLGGVAWAGSQPYAVYFPLLLIGSLAAVLSACLLPGVRKRYQELELRKIHAMDATSS